MKKLVVGDTFRTCMSLSQEDLDLFTRVSGDTNNIHVDPKEAARSRLRVIAVPGNLPLNKISGIHGTQFPGHGTIYVTGYANWRRPMLLGVTYDVEVKVTRIRQDARLRRLGRLRTTVTHSESGKVALVAIFEIMHADLIG